MYKNHVGLCVSELVLLIKTIPYVLEEHGLT